MRGTRARRCPCRNDAAFAALAGASPLQASSGRMVRNRLNRGGDRQLNRALHDIVKTRRPRAGSSGAPVMGDDGRVLGLHQRFIGPGSSGSIVAGLRMDVMLADLGGAGCDSLGTLGRLTRRMT